MLKKYFFKKGNIRYLNISVFAIVLSQLLVGFTYLSRLITIPEIVSIAIIYITGAVIITLSLFDFIRLIDHSLKSLMYIILNYALNWKVVVYLIQSYPKKIKENRFLYIEHKLTSLRC